MTTDYDPIAEQYKRSKLQPWRTHVESYTLMGLLGDLSGKSVVDVACGDGYYTRLLRAHGARTVRGIDLSERMIALSDHVSRMHDVTAGSGQSEGVGAYRPLHFPIEWRARRDLNPRPLD